MKSKVKKFGRGGDILTALGAGLAGYGAYKYLTKDKGESKDDDYTRRVKEYGTKGKFPEEKSDEKADAKKAEAKVADDRDEARERALRQSKGRGDLVPEGADKDALYESDKALVRTDGGKTTKANKKPAVVSQQNQNKNRQASSTNTGKVSGIKDTKKRRATSLDAYRGITAGQSQDAAAPAKEERKKDVTTSLNDRNAVTLDKGTGKAEDKKYGIGPYGAFSSIHRALSDTRSEEQKQKSADAIFNATRGKAQNKKAGGMIKKYASGGSVSSASKRADGCAIRGKTRA
jgi:hypothetical protein